jgi:hypothetical protein
MRTVTSYGADVADRCSVLCGRIKERGISIIDTTVHLQVAYLVGSKSEQRKIVEWF